MYAHLLRRLALFVPTLFGLSVLVFSLVRLLPGDVVSATVNAAISPEQAEQLRRLLGLEGSWLTQYIAWVGKVVRGDLGTSLYTHRPVWTEIMRRLPVTIELSVLSLLVSIVLAVPGGVAAAMYRNRWPDMIVRFISFLGLGVPHFWIATLFLVYGAIYLQWVPPLTYVPLTKSPGANLLQFLVPSIVLGLHMAARTLRMTRSSLLETLREDFIRTARAKGLRNRRVVWYHALRHAAIPIITDIGIQFGYLLGGTVIIENIFAMPGIGRQMVDAIGLRDYPQIQGSVLILGLLVLVVNLVVDVAYALIDPRIAHSQESAEGKS